MRNLTDRFADKLPDARAGTDKYWDAAEIVTYAVSRSRLLIWLRLSRKSRILNLQTSLIDCSIDLYVQTKIAHY